MVAFVLAGGFARLIGSGACRVARSAFRARSLRGKTRLLGDRPTGGAALVREDLCWAGVALSVGYRGEGR